MSRILHLLLSEPDELVADLVCALDGDTETRVICLYPDGIGSGTVDWNRLVGDIMEHDTTICWW